MAITSYSATKAAARSINVGPTGVADIYSNLRKYDQTSRIISMSRSYAPMLTLLSAKLSRIKVDDPEPRIWLDAPHEGSFTPTETQTGSTNGTYFKVKFGTTYIRFIRPGDLFTVVGVFFRPSAAVSADDWDLVRGASNGDSEKIYSPETILVTDVDYASGYATVLRGMNDTYGGSSATCATAITTSMKLHRGTNAHAEGSRSPAALSTQPMYDDNYIQIPKKSWGMTETESETKTWIGTAKEEMQRRAVAQRDAMMQGLENDVIFGKKAKYYDASGNLVRTFGGVLELIEVQSGQLGDGLVKVFDLGDNELSITGPYTSGGMYQLTEKIFTYGNQKKSKISLVGSGFITEFNSLFPDSIRTNQELTEKLKIDVSIFKTAHGQLNLMHEPLFTVMAGSGSDQDFNRQMFNCDLDYLYLMEMEPIHVQENIHENDYHGVKHQLIGQVGLWRAYPDAHSYVYGVAQSA